MAAQISGLFPTQLTPEFTKAEVTIFSLQGEQIRSHTKEIGKLVATIYREWPYLYEATEEEYVDYVLDRYVENPKSIVFLACIKNTCIGVSMGTSFDRAPENYKEPFQTTTYNLEEIFYWGEFILLSEYRGKGIGGQMQKATETYAMDKAFKAMALCTMRRPPDFHLNHLKPQIYKSTDTLWEKWGFTKREDLTLTGVWRLVGEKEETPQPMIYWWKSLK